MDVFEFGQHRLSNEPFQQVDYEKLLGGKKVDLLYTDPPWNEDLMDYYADLQREQSPEPVVGNLTYSEMLSELCRIADEHVDGFVVIESQAEDATTLAYVKKALHNVEYQEVEYRDYACGIYIGSTSPEYTFDVSLRLTSGLDTMRAGIKEATDEGDVVMDVMCGKGSVAKAALLEGCTFIGNDFNTQRVNETKELLEDMTE